MGSRRCPEARGLFITADAGGGSGYRSHTWKLELQRFADETGVGVHVSHFPPDAGKRNGIEHRPFPSWRD